MAICDNMKAIRRKKGMTQKQVAEACGLADSTIRTYELGNANPKPATVAKIAKALGVSAAELYGVDWMPGISVTLDQEANSALYQSLLVWIHFLSTTQARPVYLLPLTVLMTMDKWRQSGGRRNLPRYRPIRRSQLVFHPTR